MRKIANVGLVLCLSVSGWLVGCGDDDGAGDGDGTKDSGVNTDAGPKADGGGGLPGMDAGRDAGLDSGPVTPTDSGTVTDAAQPATDASSSLDAAAPTSYAITLTTAQAACGTAAAGATGTATVVVSADDSKIDVELTYSGLSAAPVAAHIHAGASGAQGPVVLPFAAPLTSPIKKTFIATDYVAATGAPATFAAFVTSLKAGNAYLNVHTAACGAGEIRGQIK